MTGKPMQQPKGLFSFQALSWCSSMVGKENLCDFITHHGLSIFSHLTTNVLSLNYICFVNLDCVFPVFGSFPFTLFHILYFLRAMILQPQWGHCQKRSLEFVQLILCKKATCPSISRTSSPHKMIQKNSKGMTHQRKFWNKTLIWLHTENTIYITHTLHSWWVGQIHAQGFQYLLLPVGVSLLCQLMIGNGIDSWFYFLDNWLLREL